MISKLLVIYLAALGGLTVTTNWKSDGSKAKISFSIKGPFGTVNGKFSGLQTEIKFDEKDLGGSSISASVETKTISTGNGLRNSDLRNKEIWFNADKYPIIRFRSKKIEKISGGFQATGDLTMKDVTRSVVIPFTFASTGETGIFKGKLSINREDYHLGKKGGSVGNAVSIQLEVPVKK